MSNELREKKVSPGPGDDKMDRGGERAIGGAKEVGKCYATAFMM